MSELSPDEFFKTAVGFGVLSPKEVIEWFIESGIMTVNEHGIIISNYTNEELDGLK